jgi:hypothetical protein
MNTYVHCINLPEAKERKESAKKQAFEQGFDIKFFQGVIVQGLPFTGVSRAHKNVIRYAKAARLPFCIVMEDDCIFSAKGAFDYYISKMPKSFDMYWGGCYNTDTDENGRITKDLSSTTLYTIHERFYDTFLGITEMDNIDRRLGTICYKHEFYLCQPMVCYQSNGFSYHKQEVCNYDKYLIGRELFKG